MPLAVSLRASQLTIELQTEQRPGRHAQLDQAELGIHVYPDSAGSRKFLLPNGVSAILPVA